MRTLRYENDQTVIEIDQAKLTVLRRYGKRRLRLRDRNRGGAELLRCIQPGRDQSIGQRDAGRHPQTATYPDRLTVHEAEIGQYGAGQCEGRGVDEFSLDDEHRDGA